MVNGWMMDGEWMMMDGEWMMDGECLSGSDRGGLKRNARRGCKMIDEL